MDTEYQRDIKNKILDEKLRAATEEREYWQLKNQRLREGIEHA